eukprot:TRINITY_DN13533_c0_g1_i1.p1 TRINITY_DN13533_c0_g1~~TRINITY_DN13533_c0_g1_i1.p1  ORF type:complete len:171 (-),score=29.51 TRINITY_DN13533_c0_g1_i1:174-641(-)
MMEYFTVMCCGNDRKASVCLRPPGRSICDRTLSKNLEEDPGCPACSGRGFMHSSVIPHDKDTEERCFFCHDCEACGGSGIAAKVEDDDPVGASADAKEEGCGGSGSATKAEDNAPVGASDEKEAEACGGSGVATKTEDDAAVGASVGSEAKAGVA